MHMLVFPYGHDCEPIIRHANMLKPCYEIVALVSPGGWGMVGKEIRLGDNGRMLSVYETFEEVEEEFDSLFIPSFESVNEAVENRLIDKVLKLIPRLSNIICVARLTDGNRKRLEEICQRASLLCRFIDFSEQRELETYGLTIPIERYPSLKSLDVPVVIVAGLWEKTDKFEISLSLRKRFMQDGYRVSQVGSRNGCEMMGFHSFPGFMFQRDLDGGDKIPCFNQWIYQIVKREQPDVVLITVPGAVRDYNEKFTRGFGVMHYEIFHAVMPDVLVMCTFYMREFGQALEDISMFCKYGFDAPVDVFHMSNLFIDMNDSEQFDRIITSSIYRRTVSETVDKKFAYSSIPVFNGIDPEECDGMYEALIEKLTPKDVQAVY